MEIDSATVYHHISWQLALVSVGLDIFHIRPTDETKVLVTSSSIEFVTFGISYTNSQSPEPYQLRICNSL